jgi:pimeloyl-ACP methyl ester carboxylesterase
MKTAVAFLMMAGAMSAHDAFRVKVTGTGKPMILIPGLSSSGEVWDTTVAKYKDRFECHVLTLAGFAGVPRVPPPFLDGARDAIAAYIREKKMVKPVIVGHSLGGYLAMDLAARYPDIPGRIVIVDSYPFLMELMDPGTTPEKAKGFVKQMVAYLNTQTQEQWDTYLKTNPALRGMVTKDSDFEKIMAWGLNTDRSAATDAMMELYSADARDELAKVRCPVMVLATYVGFPGATREGTEENLKRQYAKLSGVEIHISSLARHFLMWDDPDWMFGQMDRFLK